MFSINKCIPCQGGIPPLNEEEINNFKKLINSDWLVEENKKIIREFNFSTTWKELISQIKLQT